MRDDHGGSIRELLLRMLQAITWFFAAKLLQEFGEAPLLLADALLFPPLLFVCPPAQPFQCRALMLLLVWTHGLCPLLERASLQLCGFRAPPEAPAESPGTACPNQLARFTALAAWPNFIRLALPAALHCRDSLLGTTGLQHLHGSFL